jgi:predicted transcriptional regulator
MAVSTKLIAQEMDLVWKGIKPAISALRYLLIESLSHQEKQSLDVIEDFCSNGAPGVITKIVADRLSTTETNAGNILLRLVEYGLVQRKLPDKGKGYIYFVDVVKE